MNQNKENLLKIIEEIIPLIDRMWKRGYNRKVLVLEDAIIDLKNEIKYGEEKIDELDERIKDSDYSDDGY